MDTTARPSKKQRELLLFIEAFIHQHGYGPSYREIMSALGYKSVSTVAIHIDNLIKKGHLQKRTKSARSLYVVAPTHTPLQASVNIATESQEKWLVQSVTDMFNDIERNATKSQKNIDNLFVLVGALHILGFADAARSFKARLLQLTDNK